MIAGLVMVGMKVYHNEHPEFGAGEVLRKEKVINGRGHRLVIKWEAVDCCATNPSIHAASELRATQQGQERNDLYRGPGYHKRRPARK